MYRIVKKRKIRDITAITLAILLIIAVFACLIGYCVKENKKVEISREIINVQHIPRGVENGNKNGVRKSERRTRRLSHDEGKVKKLSC